MRAFAKAFYGSVAWQRCRDAYASSVGGLCERCLRRGLYNPGEIVHHTTELTPENISDVRISLGWDNLELVCRDCHAELHQQDRRGRRYRIDEFGRVLSRGSPPGRGDFTGPPDRAGEGENYSDMGA